jgi:NAD(P)-dependent dehydrogenase (short-subunit alcohol dehydrogenase family)
MLPDPALCACRQVMHPARDQDGEAGMAGRLQDRVALITGAGSIGPGWGNGKATAVLFAREGAQVFAVDLNLEAAEETRRIIEGEGGVCRTHRADVARADSVQAMVDACMAVFGRIDVLVNNVGIARTGSIVTTEEADWDLVSDVNLKSVYLVCRKVVPIMERQGRGAIVKHRIDRGPSLDGHQLCQLLRDQGGHCLAVAQH